MTVRNTSDAPDNNPANDTATIVFNPTGGLPITGTPTVPLTTAGAMLLILGTLTYTLTYTLGRRHRTH